MGNIFYVDGEFVDSEAAQVPADDLAVLRGYGIFDFTRTYGGRPFRLDDHLQRLQRSAELILLELPLPVTVCDGIRDVALETLARNGYPGNGADARLRIVVTGGSSPDDITPAGPARLLMLVTPFAAQPAARYREGIKIITRPAGALSAGSQDHQLRPGHRRPAPRPPGRRRGGHLRQPRGPRPRGHHHQPFRRLRRSPGHARNGDPARRHAPGRAGAGRPHAGAARPAAGRAAARRWFSITSSSKEVCPVCRWMRRASARARPARTALMQDFSWPPPGPAATEGAAATSCKNLTKSSSRSSSNLERLHLAATECLARWMTLRIAPGRVPARTRRALMQDFTLAAAPAGDFPPGPAATEAGAPRGNMIKVPGLCW